MYHYMSLCTTLFQVALKRQQATEDAIALGLRAVATGGPLQGYLPPGPIYGMSITDPITSENEETENSRDHHHHESKRKTSSHDDDDDGKFLVTIVFKSILLIQF